MAALLIARGGGAAALAIVLAAGCGDSGGVGDTFGFDPMPGAVRGNRIISVVIDAHDRPIAAASGVIWRFSEARQEWGEVGLGGRSEAYLPGPIAVAPDDTMYATTTAEERPDPPVFMLPPGGGRWVAFDDGLAAGAQMNAIAVDHAGVAYGAGIGAVWRRAPGDPAWTAMAVPDGVAYNGLIVGPDNTVFLSDDQTAYALPDGASAFVALPGVRRVHSVNPDGSRNVTMSSGANGRLAAGAGPADLPTPYPAFPEESLAVTTASSYYAATPVPFAVDAQGVVYSDGFDGDFFDVLALAPGDAGWTPLNAVAEVPGRLFTVAPNGDVYSYSSAEGDGIDRRKR